VIWGVLRTQARLAFIRKMWLQYREGLVWLREQRVIRLQAQWRGISVRNARRRYYRQKEIENEAAFYIQV
jgi:hypothetical protein